MKHDSQPCPKCGYDQSGIISTWEDQCPMEGRCPECGLDFEWANVFDSSRVDLPWYVEHARSPWRMIRRTIPTLWYLLIPNRYWKRVGIESQIRLFTLVLWSVLLVGVLHTVSTTAFVFSNFFMYYEWANGATVTLVDFFTEFNTFEARKILYDRGWWFDSIVSGVGYPYFNRNWWWPDLDSGTGAARSLVYCYGITLMWVIILSVVPTTRRLAQLKYGHVARALLISLLMPVVFFESVRLIDASILFSAGKSWFVGSGFYQIYLGPYISQSIVYLMVLWIQWHWVSAIRSGWKIRRSKLLLLIGLLGSSVCSYLLTSLLYALWFIFEHSLY